jgi:hypothetical protein
MPRSPGRQPRLPSFEKQDLVGLRLERTEIAPTHLSDGTTYAA